LLLLDRQRAKKALQVFSEDSCGSPKLETRCLAPIMKNGAWHPSSLVMFYQLKFMPAMGPRMVTSHL
jgi:hypothetical protein